ncbi:hypothetical protein IP86_09415 [Rhodopseudomonas sp. AAP120]|jgi:Protein of unknown function (DUF992)|uniref:DUF992 domain-containing protein n=1 Tax=Rhodopseudomonas sp. AAP120 TaxID=1523430 RepID=UPI0006B9ECCA|nr:DUF992 domain-containing protein [Rhodopseudomonas sp. AAP120]KPF99325.1 hypothetical protein IP86_09415 [Rhodopseudomonas sp. AAP120]
MSISRLFGVAAVALVATVASASAQERLQVGVIECAGGPNVGYVVGSTTQLECVFKTDGRRPEPYVATVQRIGVDLGFTQNTGLAWAVYAPTRQVGRGDLAGSFGGVGANASFGVGFGGNLLIGGSGNAYALQPLSLQGQTGLNATAGIVDVQLRAVEMPRKYRKHKRHHRHHR